MNAILLSAGFGKRFLPYTNTIAKPSIPFFDIPFLCYSLYYAQKFGSQKVVINTHHLPSSVQQTVQNYKKFLSIDTEFVHESPHILDSGGGIKNSESILSSSDESFFFVFNTDIPHIFPQLDISSMIKKHLEQKALATFITCDLKELGTQVSGVWTEKNSLEIKDFGLGPKESLRCRHYTGFMILSNEIFKHQPPKNQPHNIIYDAILPALKNQSKRAFCHHLEPLHWLETGNLKSYLEASFATIDQLIHKPECHYSKEFTRLHSFFNNSWFMHSDSLRQIISISPINPNKLNLYKGHVIDFSRPQENNSVYLENSVISSKAHISPGQTLSNTLVL